jgi:acetolactate synthase-1/2/3 large subunit
MVTGNDLLAGALRDLGVKDFFFIMGGPMSDATRQMFDLGIRGIDVRHEQAAAMMAHAYSRVSGDVGVAMGCSGPGALNLLTGIATAWADGAPVVALGGASPSFQNGMGAFQEVDQLAIFRPVTKWSMRLTDPSRIPDTVEEAFTRARTGKPGPVYLDFPADVLYANVPESSEPKADATRPFQIPIRTAARRPLPRPLADPADIARAAQYLADAERPIIISGTGVLWSEAWDELRSLVELTGIPFFSTPQGRGVIEEDHPLSLLAARSAAFREADVVLVAGTRLNHMIGFGRPPRFAEDATFIQIDIAPDEIGHNRPVDVGLVGDAKVVLRQLVDEARPAFADRPARSAWVDKLAAIDARKAAEHEAAISTDQVPIHPLRLAKEVRDVAARDGILVVDGHEILNFSRQTIPSYVPRHRLNSGPFGTMGVGVPFAIGAKVARPEAQVIVVQGDGSFGMNGMEIDTALRHSIPIVCVIGNNAGWTAVGRGARPGTWLGHTRYDRMFEALGAHTELVEDPAGIRPALERAIASGKPAVVNVLTDPNAASESVRFSAHESVG